MANFISTTENRMSLATSLLLLYILTIAYKNVAFSIEESIYLKAAQIWFLRVI